MYCALLPCLSHAPQCSIKLVAHTTFCLSLARKFDRAVVAEDAVAADAAPDGEEVQEAVGSEKKENELSWTFFVAVGVVG
jgi:hypothetical protein